MKKSLILINNLKKNPPAAGSLSGRLLKRRASLRPPAARGLNGAENTGKMHVLRVFIELWTCTDMYGHVLKIWKCHENASCYLELTHQM